MEKSETKQNTKLGAFVLGAVVLFLTALFYMGREGTLFNKTFIISAIFKNVEGLKEGDNVWLTGVKIGTVKNVQIVSDGQVIVRLSLKDKQNEFIKKDATAFVGSDGLVGNKIVVIRPGTSTQIINDNDTINAFSPTDTQELLNIAKDIGLTARSITDDLKLISVRLNSGKGIFGELLQDGPIATDLRKAVSSFRSTAENTNKLTRKANDLLTQINEGDGLVAKLINDSTYALTFDSTMENISIVGNKAKVMATDLQQTISKMNDADNALGVVLSDTAVANSLKKTISNAQSASEKLDENMEALQHNFLFRGYFRRQEKKNKN